MSRNHSGGAGFRPGTNRLSGGYFKGFLPSATVVVNGDGGRIRSSQVGGF
jgi:hypothetical protein